jgi:hypothetical protein
MTGTGNAYFLRSDIHSLTVAGDVLVDLSGSTTYGSRTFSGGASIRGASQSGQISVSSVTSVGVTLPVPFVDGGYEVRLEMSSGGVGGAPWVTSKTGTGFVINFAGATTTDVSWVAETR